MLFHYINEYILWIYLYFYIVLIFAINMFYYSNIKNFILIYLIYYIGDNNFKFSPFTFFWERGLKP